MPLPTRRLLAALTALALLVVGATGAAASIYGPDVSSYQHPGGVSIGWGSVVTNGSASFGFVKATEGTGYTNPYFAQDFAALAANGVARGAYHFADPSSSASAQAQYFVSVVGRLGNAGDLPPVLDLETTGGLSPSALVSWTQTWLQTVQSLTGRTPMIYTGPYFWASAMGGSRAFGGYPLWIASYGVSSPQVPAGWSTWTFWQYTSSGSMPGISGSVDMNYFNGTMDQLRSLANIAVGPPAPKGNLDSLVWDGTELVLTGWGLDPSTTAPVRTTLVLDGVPFSAVYPTAPRPDIGATYPTAGPNHGFTTSFRASVGAHTVCEMVTGAAGQTVLVACTKVTVPAAPPRGTFESISWNGSTVTVSGWAMSIGSTGSIPVTMTVGGRPAATATANGSRPDVAAVYPLYGAAHGFQMSFPAPAGPQWICLTVPAIGTFPGGTIGCHSLTVPTTPPFGAVATAGWNGRALSVQGWLGDPNGNATVPVLVTVDGRTAGSGVTSGAGPASALTQYSAFPAVYSYNAYVPAAAGAHQVCVTAVSVMAASLGCKTVSVPVTPPAGTLDSVTWGGQSVLVRGWAIDLSTASPTSVRVRVDGALVGTPTAADPRPDVALAYPASGPNHGFTLPLAMTPGTHTVCLQGTDAASTTLGCRTVVVPVTPPQGSVDSAAWDGSAVAIRGWALSLSTAAPIQVGITLDGKPMTSLTASLSRSDVASAFPVQGGAHGFLTRIPVGDPGLHAVCITTVVGGVTKQVACTTVDVPRLRTIGIPDPGSGRGRVPTR